MFTTVLCAQYRTGERGDRNVWQCLADALLILLPGQRRGMDSTRHIKIFGEMQTLAPDSRRNFIFLFRLSGVRRGGDFLKNSHRDIQNAPDWSRIGVTFPSVFPTLIYVIFPWDSKTIPIRAEFM